ncbi:MAG: Ig-like domain-containing protein [Arenimonas sp.]|jgi:RHS repeat-associated protein
MNHAAVTAGSHAENHCARSLDQSRRLADQGKQMLHRLVKWMRPKGAGSARSYSLVFALLCLLALPGTAWSAPTVTFSTSSSTSSEPGSFELRASAGGPASIAYVDFYSNGAFIRRIRAYPYTYVYSGLAAGSYTLKAIATDTMDESAESNAVTVTVTSGANNAPTATLISPANNATGVAPASFSMEAEAWDTDGTLISVRFMSGTTELCRDTSYPYTCTYTFTDGGNYALKAVATDNAGATGTSAAVNISVTWPPNILPTVTLTSPYDGAWNFAPATFALGADATDVDGTISKVVFKSNGAVIATDTTAPYSYSYANLAAGTYAITATATDNRGDAVTSAVATVTVAPAPAVSLTRTYVYDANQRLCKTINPESGATVIDYDAAGNIAWTAEGTTLTTNTCDRGSVTAGQKTVRTYDAMNRVIAVSTPGGTADLITTYEPDGRVSSLTAANPGGINVTTTYSYNQRRLLTAETSNNNDEVLYGLGYGYNANGHLNEIAYPDYPLNPPVTYTLDGLGRATKVASGTTTYASNISYFPNGAIRSFTYGNGIVHTMDHAIDPTTLKSRQLPGRSRDLKGTAIILDDTYVFDKNGNVDRITDATPAGPNNRSRDLGYDGLDRLIVADALYQWGQATYAYDALDNLRLADQGARKYRYNYDPTSNRLTSIKDPAAATQFTLGYDARGNTTSKDGVTSQAFVFDAANRLNEVTGQQVYRYDGQGRRVQTTDVGSGSADDMYWIYSQSGQVLYTHESRRSRNLSYIYLGNTQVATRAVTLPGGAETISYQHTDSLGSIVAETNASGVVTKRNSYAPYGEAYAPTVIDGTGYTGHVMDQATGLTYMQQRYYDPQVGRFLSVDPVSTDAEAGENFNRYWYANNNPYRFTDPDGRFVVQLGGTVGGAVLGVLAQAGSDLIHGELSSGGTYAGAAAGGAVAGLILTTTLNPAAATAAGTVAMGALAGGAGGATSSITQQMVDDGAVNDPGAVGKSTALGAVVGAAAPGAKIPGITTGRNSFAAVAKTANTKLANGTIKTVSATTVAKSVVASTAEGSKAAAAEVVVQTSNRAIDKLKQ